MSLKTAWLNLQDGLGNRFAWSHVNAIYYSQAQNKLLKDKLDDMETAINAKVAKTDIVQVESTSQTTVPSSAYLKSVKDDLDSEISQLNSGLGNTIKWQWRTVNCTEHVEGGPYFATSAIDTATVYPSASLIIAIGGRKPGSNSIATACIDNSNGFVYAYALEGGEYPVLLIAFYNQANS